MKTLALSLTVLLLAGCGIALEPTATFKGEGLCGPEVHPYFRSCTTSRPVPPLQNLGGTQ